MLSPAVLLIEPDGAILDRLVVPVQAAGFDVTPAADFADAVALLRTREFHAVVTAQRLGSHNGLHLVLRARREHPWVITVVTSPAPDHILTREASMLGAMTVVAPWDNPGELLLALGPSGMQVA